MGANLRDFGRSAQRTSTWMRGLLATGALVLAFFGAVALAQGTGPTGTAYAATPEPCSTQQPLVSAQSLGDDPTISVTPNLGPSGSSATIHIYNFLPGQDVNAIFRVIGDPVVAKGKTDANGEAYLTFTVPTAPDGSYYILAAQDNRTCVHASTRFQIGPAPTPRPNTPTPAASATPIATATPIPTATPTTPAVVPTPVRPSAGTGLESGNGMQFNLFLALVALAVTASGFAVLGLAGVRRK